MLIIDASNLRSGGGAGLLIHLADTLHKRSLPFVILQNPALEKYNLKGILVNVSTNFMNRDKTLKKYIKQFNPTSIFYFGNYPGGFLPTDRKTFVSFQNLHLLDGFDGKGFSLKENIMWKLKKWFIRFNLNNAREYIVPTSFVQQEFLKTYPIDKDRLPIIPFYEKQNILDNKAVFIKNNIVKQKNTFIYNSSPHGHKNHTNLLKAWKIIIEKGYRPILKLTLPKDKRVLVFAEIIEDLKKMGATIINVNEKGFLTYPQILEEIYTSEFTIFPSFNETFGFGQVEGCLLDNKVISSNRPHVKPVLKPSASFDPESPESIANTVIRAMDTELPPSVLYFHDEVDRLVDKLYQA